MSSLTVRLTENTGFHIPYESSAVGPTIQVVCLRQWSLWGGMIKWGMICSKETSMALEMSPHSVP